MQTINRHNYEEYFLLYADGELDAAQQLTVDNFIQQNTDLAVELEALLHTKIPAEQITFTDKENLLRTEGNSVNAKNYEEYFLLYIDNELSPAKRTEVEKYVLQHPALQNEFIGLKRAVLTPDLIIYNNKKDLYRTEKRRTIYLKPWRLAAAAILIGVCAVGFWLMQKPEIKTSVADNITLQTSPPKNDSILTKPAETTQQQANVEQQKVTEQSLPKKERAVATIKKDKETFTVKLKKQDEEQPRETADSRPLITHNPIALQQKEPPATMHNIVNVPENLNQPQHNISDVQTPESSETQQYNHSVYPVAYKEINTNDDDRSLHVAMLDLNKTKVKNLFKKAGRLFGNKSKDLANEDGKLQVASFEIDTKKQ